MNSTPRIRASCRASSVLPTPVGPANRKLPIGFSGARSPERAILIADATSPIAASCPKMTSRSDTSSAASARVSSCDTDCTGTRAIFATTRSMCSGPITVGALLRRQQLLRRAGLVHDVDRLVGQVQVLEVLRRQRDRGLQRLVGEPNAVVRLVVRPQALQDLDRLLDRRLDDVDLLEPPRQRAVAVEGLLHVGERRGPDAAQRRRWRAPA